MAVRRLCRWIVSQAKTHQISGDMGINVAQNGIKKASFRVAEWLT